MSQGPLTLIWLAVTFDNDEYTAELASDKLKTLIDVEAVQHPWQQISIIIRIAPPTALGSDPITILAHIDSINRDGITSDLPTPGAGDDGSGTVTILEAFRALLVANYVPVSPVEFHFCAGEEGGLLNSQKV
ncbi:hypothetical protein GGX14DRAFT_406250 [Mycena pura]|uniref:Peptide hydrolase n=1 Tax=Mycena pura TaxID=153505 RepID=A0AAD6UUF0_9AGAR|nr:hypothetical protein GGX14DRAFT_406250 [Mycena pura]